MTNKIVAIQGDNLKKINIKTDTTIFLANEAQNKGYKLFYYYPENLSNIRGKTVSEGYFIKATADSSATGIGLKIEDREILNKYPYINFNIQVLKDFSKNPLQKEKNGHDFVCRLMTGVGKKIGSKVVSLSHSSWLEEGYSQNSPWSSGAKDIIVSSDNSGKPIQIKVNVLEILEQHHPSLKGNINFLALFTDSNNSKEKVECLYRDIFFSK